MRKSTCSFVNCHVCGSLEDVSKTAYVLNGGKKETCGQSCSKCGTVMTIVITMQGLRTLENLIKIDHENRNKTRKSKRGVHIIQHE